MTQHRTDSQAGFTLLEILVALAVFGFLMLGLAQAMRFGIGAMRLQSVAIERQSGIEAAERALRRMIGDIDRGSIVIGPPYFVGGAHEVSFTTTLPMAGEAAAQLVDVAIGVDHRHRVVVRWQPHFVHRIGATPPPETVPLLEGVDHVDLSYWQQAAAARGWIEQAPANAVPDLVRLRLVFVDKSRRRWPDIVAATARN